jgi:hypothetical protein
MANKYPNKYAILGIHGEVARVRMFVKDEQIDEDFPISFVPEGMGQTEKAEQHIKESIIKRVSDLEKNNV